MHPNVQPVKIVPMSPRLRENTIPPTLAKLTKKMHFLRFLQKEMGTVRTEAEREAVLGILMKTKIQVHTLQQEWNEIRAMGRFDQSSTHAMTECLPSLKIH